MMLVWDSARSFRRHIEEMGRFRCSHDGTAGLIGSFRDMPVLFEIDPVDNPGRTAIFATVMGRPAVVPIWEIDLPPGSRN